MLAGASKRKGDWKEKIMGLLHAYKHYQAGHRLSDVEGVEIEESSPGHECSTCGKAFDTEIGLKIHQAQKDHGGDDQ